VAPGQSRCRLGFEQSACIRYHVRELVPALRQKSGSDRECPVCRLPISFNPGTKGQWCVWCCDSDCDPVIVRAALEDLRIDAGCLGNYGSGAWVKAQERKKAKGAAAYPDRAGTVMLAAARRSYVIEKLYERDFDSVALLKVCIRAVFESDGTVSPDPALLLPRDYRELAALARRAGVERCYSYKLARSWLSRQVAGLTPVRIVHNPGQP
jgi:hypothetical protein